MRKLKWILIPIVVLAIAYVSGPSPDKPVLSKILPVLPTAPEQLDDYIRVNERAHHIKPDNEARIVWADSSKRKTKYSVIYLPGFGASQGEGMPVHTDFAKRFHCNLYLARPADHGIDTTEQMINVTVDRLWNSAKDALVIGKAIGDSVIILSTSTGGTLAIMLAAEYPHDVYALLNMSPNIAVRHPLAFISNNHWGLQIGRIVMHGKYLPYTKKTGVDTVLQKQYWYTTYRLEAVSQLQEMIEGNMTKATFQKVRQPSLSLYYYKNEQEQDATVSVDAILKMNEALGTPSDLKQVVAIPNAGNHVIGSYITSKDIPGVESALEKFATEKLHLP